MDIIREAQNKFNEVDRLLTTGERADTAFYDTLNEATQSAYVLMNEGMCESLTVCHQCAQHRDFLQTMILTLEPLAHGAPAGADDLERLEQYRTVVGQILERIASYT